MNDFTGCISQNLQVVLVINHNALRPDFKIISGVLFFCLFVFVFFCHVCVYSAEQNRLGQILVKRLL